MNKLKIAIDQILKKLPGVIAIYHFGSFGTEYERADSDIDLAVLTKRKIDKTVLWDLTQGIAIALRRDVDLIDLRQASTIFRFQILNEGRRIFCRDDLQCDLFETAVDSEYLSFKERLTGIFQDIEERGSVYG